MSPVTIGVLRVVILLSLAGSVVVQVLILPALWADLSAVPLGYRVALVAVIGLWVVCLQVVAVCIWLLVGMVAADAVFSPRAFVPVNVVIGAISAAAALTASVGLMLVPGETAPGVVGLILGAALVTAGVALVVVVMRSLLRKATSLRAELDEVV